MLKKGILLIIQLFSVKFIILFRSNCNYLVNLVYLNFNFLVNLTVFTLGRVVYELIQYGRYGRPLPLEPGFEFGGGSTVALGAAGVGAWGEKGLGRLVLVGSLLSRHISPEQRSAMLNPPPPPVISISSDIPGEIWTLDSGYWLGL